MKKHENQAIRIQILLVLLFILLNSIQLYGQYNFKFKKILPRSQWSEYSHDKSHHAVLLDEQGNTFIISQGLGPVHLVIQKINAHGELLWAHPDRGLNISPAMLEEDAAGFAPVLASDGKGGVFVLYAYSTFIMNGGLWWYDYDVYLQHVDSDGNLTFGAKGIPVLANSDVIPEYPRDMVSDGNGGVFALFSGQSNCPWGTVYLQHIDSSGSLLFSNPGIIVSECDTVGVVRIVPESNSGYFLIGINNYLQKIDVNGEFVFPAPWVKTGLFDLNGLYFFSPGKNEHILLGTNYHFNTIMGQKINAIGELFWGDHGVTFTWPDSIDTGQIISNTDDNRYYIFSSQYYMVLNQD